MPVGDPFTDSVPKNSLVVARGSYAFLRVALKVNGSVTTPDSNAFTFTDVATILDPDGNDVTSQFETVALDPNDPDDVYDAAHATYVGDEATPNNIGIFHNGSGRIAQKIRVPTSAEITNSSSRSYKIRWKIYKNGQPVIDEEVFDVAPEGVLIFNADVVTASEVKRGISTKLTDPDIESLIDEATNLWARGILVDADIDPDLWDEVPESVRNAIILYARSLIFDYDASAFRKINSLGEGSARVGFAGNSSKDADALRERAEESIMRYVKRRSGLYRPKLTVARQADTDGEFKLTE